MAPVTLLNNIIQALLTFTQMTAASVKDWKAEQN